MIAKNYKLQDFQIERKNNQILLLASGWKGYYDTLKLIYGDACKSRFDAKSPYYQWGVYVDEHDNNYDEIDILMTMLMNVVAINDNLRQSFALGYHFHSDYEGEGRGELSTKEPDIRTLQKTNDDYPKRLLEVLGDNAPEQLFVWGNLELLNRPAVGFCGSRNVSDKGLAVTEDVTKQIAELGWVAVSGHARGVDSMAHRIALENNAGTIIVLPQGLEGFKLRTELRKSAKRENLLIISEFPMDAGWAVGRAMQRNRTIIALSNAMVLVESSEKGGTFNAGKTALKYNHPLFVVDFKETGDSNAGNKFFIQKDAIRLGKSPTTNRANIKPLQEKVENHLTKAQTDAAKQLALFETEM